MNALTDWIRRHRFIAFFALAFAITWGLGFSYAAVMQGGAPPHGCTVFTVSKGDRVFFGGNGDWIERDSYYWVDPGGATGYGAIWVGTRDNVQQGVNEVGLAYDANGLPRVDVNPHAERAPVSGSYASYPIHILRACATVEEVVAWVNTHRWHTYMHDQMQFADATGDAVIISAGADGELVYTRKPRGDGYLVSTNFNVANPINGYGYPCSRYETAQAQLRQQVKRAGELTSRDAASVLDAVHAAGGSSWTIVSLLADLPNGTVYLYYFYQFDRPVVLDVADEIANPRPAGPLSRLFPEDVQQEAARRYQRIQARASYGLVVGRVWAGLVLASLVGWLALSIVARRGSIVWLPVVALLGPLGLLVWLVAGCGQEEPDEGTGSTWRAALVETAFGVTPTVVAFVILPVAIVSAPQATVLLQILVIFGAPLLIGWLAFQGPLLALATRTGYLRTLSRRLPQAWVVANLGMGGINALAVPLLVQSFRIAALYPLSPWTLAFLWAIAVAGALAGGLLLFPYASWAVRRGFRAWSVLGSGKVISPPWRRVWWWIPLSYAGLVGGVLASTLLQQLLSA
jgi:hypothetical protein